MIEFLVVHIFFSLRRSKNLTPNQTTKGKRVILRCLTIYNNRLSLLRLCVFPSRPRALVLPYNTCCVWLVCSFIPIVLHTQQRNVFSSLYIYWRVLSIGELYCWLMGVIHDVYRESLLTFVDSSGPNRCSEIVLCARSCVSCALAAAQTVVLRPTCSSTAKYDERDDNSSSLLLALSLQ